MNLRELKNKIELKRESDLIDFYNKLEESKVEYAKIISDLLQDYTDKTGLKVKRINILTDNLSSRMYNIKIITDE